MSKEEMKLMLAAAYLAGYQEGYSECLKRTFLVRADEREECLNCYSPDDTATDWADKIRARSLI